MYSVGDTIQITSDGAFFRDVFQQSESLRWDSKYEGLPGKRGNVLDVSGGLIHIAAEGHTLWVPEFVIEKVAAGTGHPSIGATVRVKASVTSPTYGWGSVSAASVGTLKSIDGPKVTVDFPEQKDWIAALVEIEAVPVPGAPMASSAPVAGSGVVAVGSRVRVRRDVAAPRFGWGPITHSDVGTVTAITDSKVTVNFPSKKKDWLGYMTEMEVVPAGGSAGPAAASSGAAVIGIGSAVRIKPSVSTPSFGWGSISHRDVGRVVAITGADKCNIDFPAQKGWAGKLSELMLDSPAASGSGPLVVGASVSVAPHITTPKYGWGRVSAHSVGVVSKVTGDVVTVNFPEQAGWSGSGAELRVVDRHPVVVGSRVRLKPSVTKPKYGWGSVRLGDVGVVLELQGTEIAYCDFPNHARWAGALEELEVVPASEATPPAPPTAPAAAGVSGSVSVGDRVRVKPGIVPKHGWGSVTPDSVGTLKSISGSRATVQFPEHATWRGEVSELEVAPAGGSGSTGAAAGAGVDPSVTVFAPMTPVTSGAIVRVRANVVEPRSGWGAVSHASVGTVTKLSGDLCTVSFAGVEWTCLRAEVEALPQDARVPTLPTSRPSSVADEGQVPGRAVLRRALSTSDECVVCLENCRNVTLVHGTTGHLAVCTKCADTLDTCPMCREPVTLKVTTF